MNEQDFGRKVGAALDENLGQLPASVTRRLAVARAAALDRAQGVLPVNVGAGHAGVLGWMRNPRVLAPALGLVFALLAVLYFQETQRLQQNFAENADLDAQMLGDELPVTAYLDQGFEIWLYHQSPASQPQ